VFRPDEQLYSFQGIRCIHQEFYDFVNRCCNLLHLSVFIHTNVFSSIICEENELLKDESYCFNDNNNNAIATHAKRGNDIFGYLHQIFCS
jgi:hypothetical protein